MYRRPHHEVPAELRDTLEAMEGGSHLGLDDKAADNLRTLLLRRIAMLEDALSLKQRHASSPASTPIPESLE
jgi:hypothetical protein